MWTKMFFVFFVKKLNPFLPRKQNSETQMNEWNVTILRGGKKVSTYFSTVLMIETYFKLKSLTYNIKNIWRTLLYLLKTYIAYTPFLKNLFQAMSVSLDSTIMKLEPRTENTYLTVFKTEPWWSTYLITRSAVFIWTNPVIPSAGEEALAVGLRAEQKPIWCHQHWRVN